MERNYGIEIDSLRKELNEIRQLLHQSPNSTKNTIESNEQTGHIKKAKDLDSDPNIMNILSKLEDTCNHTNQSGALTYIGTYASGGRQSTWIGKDVNTDDLLYLIENNMAEKVLNCIGNNARLNILLNILKKPMTVAQLVEECGYNSTGQVYHHLKPLIAADLIIEDVQNEGRGFYAIQPHRVQGIIMLLSGISDMLNPKYTQGNW